ncbi:hypothetical protein C5F59_027530 [Streptomyces sp. QL37]|uniref:hypothetical protein n=1 Tax=Streptomyces sp. QL37 TaxID=2093747 RepID=UPI001374F2DE|nr:hypothetical protein [Streptomyces sp. QL37]
MAGIAFLVVIIVAALILGKVAQVAGLGPVKGCGLILVGVALLISWLESAGIFS